MKPKLGALSFRLQSMITVCCSLRAIAALLVTAASQHAQAVDATWTGGGVDALWSTGANWSATPVPGTGNTAIFNNIGNANTTLSLNGITVKTIRFDTGNAAAYTLGSGTVNSQTFTLNDAGAITMNATVTNNELFNARINLGSQTGNSYTFTNNSTTNSLTFAGTVQSGTGGTTGGKTLNLGGAGDMSFATILRGSASSFNLAKTGAGAVTLGGAGDNVAIGFNLNGGSLVLAKASSAGVHAIGSNSTLTNGTLQLGGSGNDQIFDNVTITVNGGIFDLNGKNETIGALAGTSGTVLNSSDGTTSTLTVGGSNVGGQTYSGVIADNAGGGATGVVRLAKTGSGTQTLTGANTYTGGTTINGGTINVTGSGTLGSNTAGNNIAVNAGGNLAISAAGKIGSNQTVTVNSSATGIGGFGIAFAPANLAAIPTFSNNRTGTTTGGVFGINTGGFDLALDMSTFGGGGMFLGSQLGGTYTGTTLGVDGTIYRLGGGGGALTISNAVLTGAGNSVVIGDTRTNGGGTVILSEDNTYDGSTTIAAGTLQLGSGGTTGSISNSSGVINNGTLAFNRSNDLTYSQAITGTGGISKLGGNTLTLGTTISTGAIAVSAGTLKLGASGTSTGALTMGAGGTAGTLDLNGFDQTVTSLTVNTSSNTNFNTITVDAGNTLTVNGNVVIGPAAPGATLTSRLDITGGGVLDVTTAAGGIFQVGGSTTGSSGGAGNNAILDLTGLSSATINTSATGTFRVNNPQGGNTAGVQAALFLPTPGAGVTSSTLVTTITAANFNVGDGGGNNAGSGQINSVVFGTGLTTLNANTVNIGTGGRDLGSATFADSNASLKLRAADGTGRTAINMGTGTATTGVINGTGVTGNLIDLTGISSDLLVSTLTVGNQPRNASSANDFKFDTGTLDATGLVIGADTQSNATATNTPILTSSVTIGGGTTTIGTGAVQMGSVTNTSSGARTSVGNFNVTGGTVNIDTNGIYSVRLGNNTAATGLAATDDTFSITGGVVNLSGSIVTDSTTRTTSTFTLDGGTLNMATNNIGGTTAITNLNFRSGTLNAVGEINNGAALVKASGGTLTLAGSNIYTGATNVTEGTLIVNGSHINGANYSVADGGAIGGSGSIGSSLALAAGAQFVFDPNSTLFVNGATVTFGGFGVNNLVVADWAAVANDTYTLIDGSATFDFTNVSNFGAANAFVLQDGRSAFFQQGSLQLVVIPEPSSALLTLLGLTGLLAVRRR